MRQSRQAETSLPIYQIDAFSSVPFRGNPAAVCVLDAWLPDQTLLNIAAENNLSETAFIVPRASGYDLRWFTPSLEVRHARHLRSCVLTATSFPASLDSGTAPGVANSGVPFVACAVPAATGGHVWTRDAGEWRARAVQAAARALRGPFRDALGHAC
eukprot:5100210-Pleurochrysis_carterae.AAC.3